MKDLVVVGHGGLAKEVVFLVSEINRSRPVWNLLGYISSGPESLGQQFGRLKVCGDDAWLAARREPLAVALGIGSPRVLAAVHKRFEANSHLEFPNLTHPNASGDWSCIRMGKGNLILNGVTFTTDIALGDCNLFNPGCTVAHDCELGSHNVLGPGVHLAGAAVLGSRVLLGTGAQVLPSVRICDDVVVGGGAVVAKSINEPGTYAGVPARRLH